MLENLCHRLEVLTHIHFLEQVDVTDDFLQTDTVHLLSDFSYAGILQRLRSAHINFQALNLPYFEC